MLFNYFDGFLEAFCLCQIECFLAGFHGIGEVLGCCMGGISGLPWALRFPAHSGPWRVQVATGQILRSAPESLPVHPLALYFLVLALVLGLVFLRLLPRKAYDGQVLLLFLVFHELGKFLLEFLRFPRLPAVQVPSAAAGLGAAVIYIVIAIRRRRTLAAGGA